MPAFDETDALKSYLADVQAVLKGILPLSRLKAGQSDLVEALEAAVKRLPPGQPVADGIEELRRKGQALLSDIARGREEAFGRIESQIVNTCRNEGRPIRELDTGWRIGRLEVSVDRPHSRAKLLYNLEPLTEWFAVTTVVGLARAMTDAESKLTAASLPTPTFATALRDAYDRLARPSAPRVSLRDLYPEFRLAIVRDELKGGKHDRRLKFAEFPRWAYLHNLDLYRREFSKLAPSVRLVFETGSQEDHAKGRCVVLNGLDASESYKTYCWAYAEREGR